MVSASGSWKYFRVRNRSMTNRIVITPPIGTGR